METPKTASTKSMNKNLSKNNADETGTDGGDDS